MVSSPRKGFPNCPSSVNNGARLQNICGSTPGAEAYPMYIIAQVGGQVQNIWFKVGSIGLTIGRANTEAENRSYIQQRRI